jgi:hypothetical protein
MAKRPTTTVQLSPDEARRYQELMDRRRACTLTPEEHGELLQLTDTAEAVQAERVRHLTELARLRGISLRTLIEELGLQPTDAHRHWKS